jgi:multidrug efflux pump subunit AcrA (membrane-fusion protein)
MHSAISWFGGRGAATLLVSCLLMACSKTGNPPAGAVPSPQASPAAVARGKVDIEGGLLNLSMSREGTLAKVAVHEGSHVVQGQLLARLDVDAANLAVDAALVQVQEAHAQLKMIDIKRVAATQRERRLVAAAAAGAGDGQSADDAREATAQLGAERMTAQAGLSMATQKLDAARYELKQRSLLAPVDADIVRMAAQQGATVSSSSGPLFVLLPRMPRIVRAELNESFTSAVQVGTHAEVASENAQGGTHWNAHVLRISQVFGPATMENDPQVRANSRTVECVLAFDQPNTLRIGERVIVRFAAASGAGN